MSGLSFPCHTLVMVMVIVMVVVMMIVMVMVIMMVVMMVMVMVMVMVLIESHVGVELPLRDSGVTVMLESDGYGVINTDYGVRR
jgi:hypothetical protein